MKKIIYTFVIAVILFSCKDTFEQYYQGGIPSLYELMFNLDIRYKHENSFDGLFTSYDCGVEYNNSHILLKLPPHSTTTEGIVQSTVDWKFTNIPEWMTITPSNGVYHDTINNWGEFDPVEDTIKITLTNNNSITPRTAIVFIEKSKDELKATDTLRIYQHGKLPSIELNNDNYTMKACADTVNIYLNSNCDFGVEVEDSQYTYDSNRLGWLTAAVEKSDSVGFTHKVILVSGNYIPSTYGNDYESYVKFHYQNPETDSKTYLDFSIKVTKKAPYITPEYDNSSITVTPENGSGSVIVNSNCDFEIISIATWIKPVQKSYKYSPAEQEIKISVDDYSFTGEENSDSSGGAGGGASWEETWHEYETFNDRQSSLKLCYINSSDTIILKTIYVKQSKPTIEQYDSSSDYYSRYIESLTFGPTAGTQEIYITANHTFSIQHEDWISVKTEAIENSHHIHKLTISVAEYVTDNPENWDSRNGTIVFKYYDKANNSYIDVNAIGVTQEAPKAATSTSYALLRTFITECIVSVNANCNFTPICNGDWIYIKDIIYDDPTSIYNAKIIIGFKPYPEEEAIKNNNFSQRSADLEIYYQTEHPDMVRKLSYVSLVQYPDKITTTKNPIEINSSEQTLSFDIEADLSWSATCDAEWVSITPKEGKMGKNTITLNVQQSDVERRTGRINFYLVRKNYEPTLSLEIIQVKTN